MMKRSDREMVCGSDRVVVKGSHLALMASTSLVRSAEVVASSSSLEPVRMDR